MCAARGRWRQFVFEFVALGCGQGQHCLELDYLGEQRAGHLLVALVRDAQLLEGHDSTASSAR
jgi:hypothetical protein